MEPVVGTAGSPGAEANVACGSRLTAWVEGYGPELQRHLRRMLGEDGTAEEVLQEVWIRAHRAPPEEGPGSNVRAWFFRVATNAALDHLGRRRRRRGALAERTPSVQAEPAPAPDAFLHRLDARSRRLVRERVAALPRKQREAVWLRWVEGREYLEIAEVLECSVESARANVYQAMKRLRAELRGLWIEERIG